MMEVINAPAFASFDKSSGILQWLLLVIYFLFYSIDNTLKILTKSKYRELIIF